MGEEQEASSIAADNLRPGLNTANALSIDDRDPDVPVITPSGAPGVLHEPVVQACGGVVPPPDSEHGMVGSGRAIPIIQDTAFVGTERRLCVEGNRDWLFLESGLHRFHVIHSD